jgi:hypothetical protein
MHQATLSFMPQSDVGGEPGWVIVASVGSRGNLAGW